MQAVIFTKFFEGIGVEELGRTIKSLGYDGLDLAVRPGHPVNPANATETLVPAVRLWQSMGLSCPLISLSVDANDPAAPETVAVYEAAGKAGVASIKIGYFTFKVGQDYWKLVDDARRSLDDFAKLSERTGVKTLYHTHSGSVIGSNCAGLMHLLRGRNPAHLGAHVDMGHMAVGGEDIELGLSMVRDYVAAVGAKDARFIYLNDPTAPAPWGRHFVFNGEGAAAWKPALRLLHSWGFEGPFSVHTEYTADQAVIATLGGMDRAAYAEDLRRHGRVADLKFLRDAWAEVTSEPPASRGGSRTAPTRLVR